MALLPDGEKSLKISLFIITEYTNMMDGQTHTRTPHNGISRAWIALRGKNYMHIKLSVHQSVLDETTCQIWLVLSKTWCISDLWSFSFLQLVKYRQNQ